MILTNFCLKCDKTTVFNILFFIIILIYFLFSRLFTIIILKINFADCQVKNIVKRVT